MWWNIIKWNIFTLCKPYQLTTSQLCSLEHNGDFIGAVKVLYCIDVLVFHPIVINNHFSDFSSLDRRVANRNVILNHNIYLLNHNLQQPSSSDPSRQSFSPSQWKLRGTHWLPVRHWNSCGWQAAPSVSTKHPCSSEPSLQSSSESHNHVFRMQRLLAHLNSLGSHIPSPVILWEILMEV